MLARPIEELPSASALRGGCLYEPKWDGFRTLVFRDGDEILLQNAATGDLTIDFMNGTSVTSSSTITVGNPGWHAVAAGRENGHAAIIWQNTDGTAGIWLMNGATPIA